MPQSRNQEYAGTGKWFVDSQFVAGMVVETEARDRVFGKLTGRAVGSELEARIWADERVLVDDGEVVGRDVGEVDSAAQGFPSREQCRQDGLAGRRKDGGERIVGLNVTENNG